MRQLTRFERSRRGAFQIAETEQRRNRHGRCPSKQREGATTSAKCARFVESSERFVVSARTGKTQSPMLERI